MIIYSARLAPASASLADAIRRSPDVGKETFAEDAFFSSRTVPVILSHLDRLVVGEVMARAVGGGWHVADFMLDEKYAAGVRVGNPISIGFLPSPYVKDRPGTPFPGAVRHTRAKLIEVSLLGPGERPFHPGAKVTSIWGREAAVKAARKEVAPETFTRDEPGFVEFSRWPRGQVLARSCGEILGVH